MSDYHTFYVKVSLKDYSTLYPETVRWEPIRIWIKNCQITDMTFSAIADVNYILYTPWVHIQMTEFTHVMVPDLIKSPATDCGYTVTYTPTWRNYFGTSIPLPTFINWNDVDFRFEI